MCNGWVIRLWRERQDQIMQKDLIRREGDAKIVGKYEGNPGKRATGKGREDSDDRKVFSRMIFWVTGTRMRERGCAKQKYGSFWRVTTSNKVLRKKNRKRQKDVLLILF